MDTFDLELNQQECQGCGQEATFTLPCSIQGGADLPLPVEFSEAWPFEETLASKGLESPEFVVRTKDGKGLFQTGLIGLVGAPKSGKSSVVYSLAACITTGQGEFLVETPGKVIIPVLEDPVNSVVMAKILAAGGDPSRISLLELDTYSPDGIPWIEWFLSLLESRLESNPDCKFVLIDVLSRLACLAGISINSGDGVRRLCDGLGKLAEKRRVVILLVHHFNKSHNSGSVEKMISGSIQFLASVRGLWVAGIHPENPAHRCISRLSGNLGGCSDGFVFREVHVDPKEVVERARSMGIKTTAGPLHPEVFTKIEIVAEQPLEATEVFPASRGRNRLTDRQARGLANWLMEQIRENREVSSNVAKAEADRLGLSERTYRMARNLISKNGVVAITRVTDGIRATFLTLDSFLQEVRQTESA